MHARVAPIGANSRSKFGPSSLSKFSADSRESASAMDPRRSFASQIREGPNKTPKGSRTRCLPGPCLKRPSLFVLL